NVNELANTRTRLRIEGGRPALICKVLQTNGQFVAIQFVDALVGICHPAIIGREIHFSGSLCRVEAVSPASTWRPIDVNGDVVPSDDPVIEKRTLTRGSVFALKAGKRLLPSALELVLAILDARRTGDAWKDRGGKQCECG